MRREFRITWTLAICTALALFGDATMYAVLPSQYALAGIAALDVGWMLSINRLVRPPLNVLSGYMADRLDPRLPYTIGLALGAISTAGYGLVSGFWPLLILRALWGVAWALLAVAAYAMILGVTTPETRGRATGLYASVSFFGGAFGPLLGGALVDSYGYRSAMLLLGACSAISCVLALTIPRPYGPSRRNTERAGYPRLRLRERARQVLKAPIVKDPRLALIAALNFSHRFFFAGIFYGTFGLYISTTLGEEIQIGSQAIGVAALTGALMFLRTMATVAVGPALGYVSDRLADRCSILIVGEAVGAAALAVLALGNSLWATVLSIFLAATSYGIIPPLLVAWMGDVAGNDRAGSLAGAFQTMGDIGSGLAPILAYWLLSAMGIRVLYGMSAACLVLSVPLIWRFLNASKSDAIARDLASSTDVQ